MEFTIDQIAGIVKGQVAGNASEKVSKLSKIEEAGPGSITFLSNLKYEHHLYDTQATAVIISKEFKPKQEVSTTLIKVDDPYTSFSLLLEEYDKIITYNKNGTEEPSYLGENVAMGEQVYRGAFSYIGNNVKIGNHVKIYPHAYIGDNVEIGDFSIIHSGVKIYSRTVIGKHCHLYPGAVIGSDGFGYAPQKDGSYKKIPQLGNVVLSDYVEIGANTTVDCATLGSTLLKEGVKVDNLVQIAHNVEVGKHTAMASQSGVSGSSKVGDHCIIAGQAGLIGHLKIGNKITIGAQAGVIGDFEKEGSIIVGSPAIDHKTYFRAFAQYKKLPELSARIAELEKKIINLPSV